MITDSLDPKDARDAHRLLREIRDELALQAHLFTLDRKAEWARLEARWHQLQGELSPVKRAIAQAQLDQLADAGAIYGALLEAYRRLREDLTRR